MKVMTITTLFSTTYTFQTFKAALTRYKVAQYSHNSTPKVIKILSQIVKAIIRCSPSLDFSFGVRISMIGHFYRQKWKNFTFSSLNSKHPIKVNFSIFDLEHVFSDKKSTYKKRQNGSSPLIESAIFSNFTIEHLGPPSKVHFLRALLGTKFLWTLIMLI